MSEQSECAQAFESHAYLTSKKKSPEYYFTDFRILLSVIGEGKDFFIPSRLEEALSAGLKRVRRSLIAGYRFFGGL